MGRTGGGGGSEEVTNGITEKMGVAVGFPAVE